MHVDQGLSQIRARRMSYFVATSGEQTLGAIGYTFDEHDCNVRISELIGEAPSTKGALLQHAVERATQVHAAQLIQCDVSAECPDIQQTLLQMNFVPVAYVPGMVFHATRRVDVVRFVWLAAPRELGPIKLIASAQRYFELVWPTLAARHALA